VKIATSVEAGTRGRTQVLAPPVRAGPRMLHRAPNRARHAKRKEWSLLAPRSQETVVAGARSSNFLPGSSPSRRASRSVGVHLLSRGDSTQNQRPLW